MIPANYLLFVVPLSMLVGGVLLIVYRGKYDAAAESLEQLTAEEAQSLADIFQKIANRLKTPGQ